MGFHQMKSLETENTSKKGVIIKKSIKAVLFITITGLALYYVLKDDFFGTFKKLLNIELVPFFVCLFMSLLMPIFDGIIISLFSRIYKKNYKFTDGFICSIISSCFSAFNKAGGHLIEAVTLCKQKVESYHAASIVTMNFLMYQLTLTIYSFVFIFIGYPFVKDIPLDLLNGLPIFYISILGFVIDFLFLLLILLFSLSKKFHSFLVDIAVFFIKLFHIKKDVNEYRRECVLKITTYRIEFKRLLNHKKLVFVTFTVGFIRQLITNSIPFFTLWCMDVDVISIGYLPLLSASSYLNLITTFIPTGAPEVVYQSIFSYLIKQSSPNMNVSFLSSSNLLWRFLTFYLPIIIGGLVFLFYKLDGKQKIKVDNGITMYDLEVANYQATVIESKNKVDDVVLSKEEIERSIKKIKHHFDQIKKKKDLNYYDKTLTLSEQKKQLAKVIEEVKEIETEKALQQKEIQEETEKEIDRINSRNIKKEERKRIKIKKKHPKDAPIVVDYVDYENYDFDLDKSVFIVTESHTTCDDSELDHSLDDIGGQDDENRVSN